MARKITNPNALTPGQEFEINAVMEAYHITRAEAIEAYNESLDLPMTPEMESIVQMALLDDEE